MNTSNTSKTLTLTTYETCATDQYGNNYIALDSGLDCSGCAFYSGNSVTVSCINTYCGKPDRINDHDIIWQKVENLPVINMPMNTLRHLFIESLLSIRNGTKRDDYFRLCKNLYINLVNEPNFYDSILMYILSSRFVKIFCQSWKYYSGNLDFPIPNDSIGVNCLLWQGDNLSYRISLIDHLIEKIKDDEFEQFVIDTINEYNADNK